MASRLRMGHKTGQEVFLYKENLILEDSSTSILVAMTRLILSSKEISHRLSLFHRSVCSFASLPCTLCIFS